MTKISRNFDYDIVFNINIFIEHPFSFLLEKCFCNSESYLGVLNLKPLWTANPPLPRQIDLGSRDRRRRMWSTGWIVAPVSNVQTKS